MQGLANLKKIGEKIIFAVLLGGLCAIGLMRILRGCSGLLGR